MQSIDEPANRGVAINWADRVALMSGTGVARARIEDLFQVRRAQHGGDRISSVSQVVIGLGVVLNRLLGEGELIHRYLLPGIVRRARIRIRKTVVGRSVCTEQSAVKKLAFVEA